MQTSYAQVNKIGFMADADSAIEFLCKSESRLERIIIKNLCDEIIFKSYMPKTPWTFESVKSAIEHVDTSDGAEMYFGNEWIGSTEL